MENVQANAQAAALLEDVKNYLNITWDDPKGDAKTAGIIARGMAYLDRLSGAALDYTVEDTPRALLLDYVRYVRADAFADFMTDYGAELLSLQMQKEAARYVAEDTAGV